MVSGRFLNHFFCLKSREFVFHFRMGTARKSGTQLEEPKPSREFDFQAEIGGSFCFIGEKKSSSLAGTRIYVGMEKYFM